MIFSFLFMYYQNNANLATVLLISVNNVICKSKIFFQNRQRFCKLIRIKSFILLFSPAFE